VGGLVLLVGKDEGTHCPTIPINFEFGTEKSECGKPLTKHMYK